MANKDLTIANNTAQPLYMSSVESFSHNIQNLIYVIRNQQVMLDSDLAALYQVETKVFNQAVKRNIARFPESFRFQLNKDEDDFLKSQIVTSKIADSSDENRGGRRYLPYAFTEQGIAMLSSVLRSDVAIQVSINIMNAFVEMRRFISTNALLFERISSVELKQLQYQKQTDERLAQIFEYISNHVEDNQKVFFEGQIYDAFNLHLKAALWYTYFIARTSAHSMGTAKKAQKASI